MVPMGVQEILGTIYVAISIITIVAGVYLYSLIKKTEDSLREGYVLLFAAILIFLSFTLSQVLTYFNLLRWGLVYRSSLLLVFVVVLAAGIWKMNVMIMDLVETGVVLLLVKGDKYLESVSSLLKGLHHVCYITLERPAESIIQILQKKGVDRQSVYFLDASGASSKYNNCRLIENNPHSIISSLRKILTEKKVKHVVVDGIDKIRGIKSFELPRLIQQIALEAKKAQTQSFFLCKKGTLQEELKRDIELLVDKVKEE